MNWQEHISSDPKIMFGKPIIKGTKVPIDLILEKMSQGETVESLLLAYPDISKEDIYAIFQIAAEHINMLISTDEEVYVFSEDEGKRLDKSIASIKEGKGKSNEQIKSEVKAWLHSL